MNYYELLNIPRDAEAGVIKRAYFSAVKLHSPDFDPEGFKAIRIAYETLSDIKKRAEYDTYFVRSDGGAIASDLQNDLLEARNMIRENKYKQAADFLAELRGKNPDSKEVKCLLAEALLKIKKSRTADKLCEELLEKDPADCVVLLLRAKIAMSQGYRTKASGFFEAAVEASPLNENVWTEYMRYALRFVKWQVTGIFQRAMEQNADMFRDAYIYYLVGAHQLDLFSTGREMQYYDKFAEFYINDKNPDEETYYLILKLMPEITQKDELIPFVKKILPALENSKQRSDEDEEDFKFINAAIIINKLRSDERIHDVLADLTAFFLYEDDDKKQQLTMECYIVSHLSLLRPSIRVLKNAYPECFKLNQAFYHDVITEKKNDFLVDKYYAIQKKLTHTEKKKQPDGARRVLSSGGMPPVDEESADEDGSMTFVRANPKISRNAPCPCGSGKKSKKCCGRD